MRILYFAWVRDRVGTGEETPDVPETVSTVADLVAWLATRSPGHAEAFADPDRLRAAVNHDHVPWTHPVMAGDEVAFFPPVTGGRP